MSNRRNFLKGILAGGALLGLGPKPGAEAKPAPSRELPNGFAWQRTIFCQFANSSLASSICWLAKDLGCDICWGDPFSPDIFAVPCFVLILDRSTLDRDQWHQYLEVRKEVGDTKPCILVDDLDWPTDNYMVKLDPRNRAETYAITELIRFAHKAARAQTMP